MLPETLRSYLDQDLCVTWTGQAQVNCKVFDFSTFSDSRREALYELLTDDLLERVESGELLPFGAVGLMGAQDDLERTTPDGLLFLHNHQVFYARSYEGAALVGELQSVDFSSCELRDEV